MSTRQIKDAKDLSTNELIYFKSHAKATYMSDGRTVEEAINNSSSGSSGSGNVQAVIREGYSELETNRPIRDAKDLTTGELIYFTGNAGHIVTPYGSTLMDYIDDGDAQGRIYHWNVDVIDTTDEEIPEEVLNIIYSEQGIVLLNGGVANFDFDNSLIYSSTINDGIVRVTKIYTDFAFYQSVVINEYNLNGSGSSSGTVTSVKINGVNKSPSNGVVDLGYVNKQLSTSTSSSMTLSPNIYYRNTNTSLSSLTITFSGASNSNILNEYFIEFTTASSGTTIGLPMNIKWANGVTPTFENGTTYQLSFVNNLGVCTKFSL